MGRLFIATEDVTLVDFYGDEINVEMRDQWHESVEDAYGDEIAITDGSSLVYLSEEEVEELFAEVGEVCYAS